MSQKNNKTAISPTREEDFPMWYQAVVNDAEIAELAHARGCMVIKPWGYGIWENIQKMLGGLIKDSGAENMYFPLFIPMSYIQKEAEHVDGFAKEMAVVTHHRLKKNENGTLVPDGELTEPLVVRPTSETIIGESMSGWVKSYRDLPLMINQWCNVVRWEMRPRILLRTVEFLWQEGHTAHATKEEAVDETLKMLEVYRKFVEEYLAMPLVIGFKPHFDRFPGAVDTYCIEAMMQDGKALQAGTSHYLGQKFAKSANIQFLDSDSKLKHAHTTSWGVSTRLIGGLVMTHADDDGMRVPPRIAPHQIVIIPILKDKNEEANAFVLKHIEDFCGQLKEKCAFGEKISAKIDNRLISSVDKKWGWIKKGAPILVELGPKDIENGVVTYRLRNEDSSTKHQMPINDFLANAGTVLEDMQNGYFNEAKARLDNNITDVDSFDELKKYFSNEKTYFVRANLSQDAEEDERLKEMAVTVRCFVLEAERPGKCILTGKDTNKLAILARSY